MPETKAAKVERFKAFNQEMITAAVAESNLRQEAIPAKVLLCAIIDSLAKSRFPDTKGNRERFVEAVSTCAGWTDCERLSLLHIERAIEVAKTPTEFTALNSWVKEEISRRLPLTSGMRSVHMPISKDPLPEEISELWPMDPKEGAPKKIANQSQENFQHKHLLWVYRNNLMHEFRIPGGSREMSATNPDFAHYQQVTRIDDFSPQADLKFSNRWELLYPTGFLKLLAEQLLEGVANFHMRNCTSPFEAYGEGSYWLPGFNQD